MKTNPHPTPYSHDDVRRTVIRDISRDRLRWRLTELPQLAALFLLPSSLLAAAALGLFSTGIHFSQSGSPASLGPLAHTVVGGSSGLLGWLSIRLLSRLADSSRKYILQERRFTSDINLVRLAATREEIKRVLLVYQDSA